MGGLYHRTVDLTASLSLLRVHQLRSACLLAGPESGLVVSAFLSGYGCDPLPGNSPGKPPDKESCPDVGNQTPYYMPRDDPPPDSHLTEGELPRASRAGLPASWTTLAPQRCDVEVLAPQAQRAVPSPRGGYLPQHCNLYRQQTHSMGIRGLSRRASFSRCFRSSNTSVSCRGDRL